jgi:hypothetical protein
VRLLDRVASGNGGNGLGSVLGKEALESWDAEVAGAGIVPRYAGTEQVATSIAFPLCGTKLRGQHFCTAWRLVSLGGMVGGCDPGADP